MIEVDRHIREDLGIRLKRRLGARAFGLPDHLDFADRLTLGVLLTVDLLVALHLHLDQRRQRADHRHADAVEPAGDLVAALVELAAGMQTGHHHFQGGTPDLGMGLNRNTASVVFDGHPPSACNRDRNGVARALQRLVHAVVHDFVNRAGGGPLDRCRRYTYRDGGERLRALRAPVYLRPHMTLSVAACGPFHARHYESASKHCFLPMTSRDRFPNRARSSRFERSFLEQPFQRHTQFYHNSAPIRQIFGPPSTLMTDLLVIGFASARTAIIYLLCGKTIR